MTMFNIQWFFLLLKKKVLVLHAAIVYSRHCFFLCLNIMVYYVGSIPTLCCTPCSKYSEQEASGPAVYTHTYSIQAIMYNINSCYLPDPSVGK